jgi:uncharacterized protein with ParB-like and HNH nuclease domain
MNAIITLNEYLKKGKTFVIPNYQRGYIWGKQKRGEDKDSVTYFLEDSIIPGLKQNTEIFIQGVTVCEKANEIILIDGQQRTTFFYLLLKYLGFTEPFTIKYDMIILNWVINNFEYSPIFITFASIIKTSSK